MDLHRIINIMKKTGDKFIFIEENEPRFVILSFDEYEKIVNSGTLDLKKKEQVGLDALNQVSFETPPVEAVYRNQKNDKNRAVHDGKDFEEGSNAGEEKLLERVNKDIAEYRSKHELSGEVKTEKLAADEEHYYIEPVKQ